jgi:hypothetical protein
MTLNMTGHAALDSVQAEFDRLVDRIALIAETKYGMSSSDARIHAASEAMAAQEAVATAVDAAGELRARLKELEAASPANACPSADASKGCE